MTGLGRMFDGRDTRIEAHFVLASLAVVTALVLAGWTVIKQGVAFDVQAFGIGIGSLFAGVGAASWGRGKELQEGGDAGH